MAGPHGLLGSGLSGLQAAQTGLATAGHNIANVNTPGYTRQRVDLAARETTGNGIGFVGAGVTVTGITRVYSEFLTGQLRSSTSTSTSLDTFQQFAAQIDNLIGGQSGGLSPAIQGFFGAVHGVADDPTSVPARQVTLSRGEALVQRFQTLDRRLDEQRDTFNGGIRQIVSEINDGAAAIARINRQIMETEAKFSAPANDLRDTRDEQIRKLAERVGINTFTQDDGSITVTTGSGQALVVGATAAPLSVVAGSFDPTRLEVAYSPSGGGGGVVSSVLSGGRLGGLLNFRSQVLDPAQNAVGRVALALSHEANTQHRLGTDLNGARGGDLFTDLDSTAARVFPHSANSGAPAATLAVKLRDVGALTASDYQLERQGANYTLTRLSDGVQTTLSGFPASSAVVDGVEISLTGGTIASGDRFLIQPTRFAAGAIGLAVTAPSGIAAAAPVRAAVALTNKGDLSASAPRVNSPEDTLSITFTAPGTFDVVDATSGASLATGVPYVAGNSYTFNGLDFTLNGAPAAGDGFVFNNTVPAANSGNTGSASVSNVSVDASGADPNLTNPLTVTFTSATTFDVSGALTGSPTTGLSYTPGQPISFNGYTFSLDGAPQAGDVVTVGAATGAVGDNRNALVLAGMELATPLDGATASFETAYTREVTRVGSLAAQAATNATAQHAVQDQIVAARESTSGVNLDEEAAKLLKNQQAYQAAAQTISVANQIFQTLIQVMSR